MSVKLAVGLRNGKPVHISQLSEAERGEKCNCVCPDCKKPLSAKMGEIREYHFAHQTDSKCNITKAQAIGLFLVAKEIIQTNNEIRLPGWEISEKDFTDHKLRFLSPNLKDLPKQGPQLLPYTFVSTKDTSSDVHIEIKNKPVIIRLFVPFIDYVDNDTSAKDSGIHILKIDLSSLYENDLASKSKDIIEDIILRNIKNRTWLYNPKKESELKKISEQLFSNAHAQAIGLLQFAKETIKTNNKIRLPGWEISQKDFANHELSFLFSDDKYRTEQDPKLSTYTFVSTKDRSSDVLIKIRNHPVIIRIFVSPLLNATTPTEHSRLPMFNLDLSSLSKVDLTSPQTKSIIEEQILHNEKNKTWLNNPKKESKLKEISEQLFEDNKDYINRQKKYDNARKNIDKKKTHYTKR